MTDEAKARRELIALLDRMRGMTRLSVGDRVRIELPYSEVCMHMRVAGQVFVVEVREHGAQILNEDGSPFSFPILHGEAGIFRDAAGLYTYPAEEGS